MNFGVIILTGLYLVLKLSHGQFIRSPQIYLKLVYKNKTTNDFDLRFTLNDCYQFYPSEEVIAYSCTKGVNPESYSCIHWISGEKKCLGLRTPHNETIELACGESDHKTNSFRIRSSHKNCFSVYDANDETEKVCLQKFDDYSVGLSTSSNHSVLLDSLYCRPVHKSPQQIQEYKKFTENFIFDPSIRSCYKVYTPDQDVSPYTCLNYEVYEACIHQLENENCTGITTQNNETIVLECSDKASSANEKGCFEIYTSDDEVHSTCQKQIEERCVGIVTPSNLTVLLECQTYISTRGGTELAGYNGENRIDYRKFIEFSLHSFTQNDSASKLTQPLKIYTPEQDIKLLDCFGEIFSYGVHTLRDHEDCRGITLNNMETVVLSCPNKAPEKAGCFDVFSPADGQNHEITGRDVKVDYSTIYNLILAFFIHRFV